MHVHVACFLSLRVSCLERDLKQKRSLVNGLKEKDRSRAAFMDECQGKMVRTATGHLVTGKGNFQTLHQSIILGHPQLRKYIQYMYTHP